jgi:hypothetical protein
MLQLRTAEAASRGDTTNYFDPEVAKHRHGLIYAAYHFPTGKWYVGQTINTLATRARQHWWARNRDKDFLHLTLADDPDPMCWVSFPVEYIPKECWEEPTPKSANFRDRERRNFRQYASVREKYWIQKLNTLWPTGWNTQYPGKPAAPWIKVKPVAQPQEPEPARDVRAARQVEDMWLKDPTAARAWLQGASREDLGNVLDGLQLGLPPAQQTATVKAIAAAARDILRKRKAEKKQRDYVRLLYGNHMAATMDLPGIMKDPDVYRLHPEPDVAAAIMIVHRFQPNIAATLFNYKDWSIAPAPMPTGEAEACPCHRQVLPGTALMEGHICDTDVTKLAGPYLRDILSKGRKFRLEQPMSSVLPRLEEGLEQYVSYKVRAKRGDAGYLMQLERWADAVMAKARTKVVQGAAAQLPMPDGYPGLRDQLRRAKAALMFGIEDRAPHAIFYMCGVLYASKLHERLNVPGAFVTETRPPKEVLQDLSTANETLGLTHHNRLPYLYGGYKAKKKAFRWIAGTSRVQDETAGSEEEDKKGAPRNALSDLAGCMVKVFQHILNTLQRKDQDRQSRGLPARYWVLDDIDAFVQEFRARSAELSKVPWATYDFTTMYEGLSHTSLITAWGMAAEEAWKYEEEVRGEGSLLLGASGWYRKSGISSDSSQLWLSIDKFLDCNMHLLSNLYTLNGDCFRRQVKGLPMGLECSPQMANLYGYAIEAQWVDSKQPNIVLAKRYIDDIFVAGADAPNPGSGIPSEDDYAMKYKLTSESPDSLLYLGVRFFKDENGEAHCALHDRAVDYPIQLDRYPHASTVANPTQLGGVIMGRLVAAQRTCSRMDLFQDAVAGIFTHAFRRNYTRRLVHGVWTKFLLRYWDAAGNPTKELRDWFHRTWKGIVDAEGREAKAPPGQSPTQPSATAPIQRPLRRAPVPAADPLVEHPRPAVDEAHSGSRGVPMQPAPLSQSQVEDVPLNASQDSTLQTLIGLPVAGEYVAHMDIDDEGSPPAHPTPEGDLVPFQEAYSENAQQGAHLHGHPPRLLGINRGAPHVFCTTKRRPQPAMVSRGTH